MGEAPTRLYESFTHLKKTGVFSGIEALILGNFASGYTNEKDKVDFDIVKDYVSEWMDQQDTPVLFSDRFGHGPYNDPLPFNTPARLKFEEDNVILKVKTNN